MLKLLAREFIWLVFILFMAVPMSMLFIAGLNIVADEDYFNKVEKYFVIEIYTIIYLINVIGMYLARLLVLAIKKVVQPPPSPEE